MNSHTTTQPLRRGINYSAIYRVFMCFIACAAIFSSLSLKLTRYFDPGNLESVTLGQYTGFVLPITLREDEVMEPGKEGLVKQEIYLMDEPKEIPEVASGDDGVYPITEIDMSNGAAEGEILIKDSDSGLTVDVQKLLCSPFPPALQKDGFSNVSTYKQPLVLILHTHATECYTDDGNTSYSKDTSFRSEDITKNVVSVGKVMADILNEQGIPTVHCQTLHDARDYNASYNNSLVSVKEYLKKYPSIKYVFDVHRDAIIRESGEALKPICTINGSSTAQTMTLVGTDAGGAEHPDWQINNMNLAVKLQNKLTTDYNGMARPINLRKLSFHQQYAPGSLLFEIGSCANTLEEAKNAAANLATAIAQIISNV